MKHYGINHSITNQMVVIGVGNKLMMDDGVGVFVVEELGKRNINSDIRFISGETDVAYCLNEMKKSEVIIIVDASYQGLKPGNVNTYLLKDILKDLSPAPTSHELNLVQTLKLYGFQGQGLFIGIEVHKVELSYGLSEKLREQLENAVNEVEDIIKRIYNSFDVENIVVPEELNYEYKTK